MHGICHLRRFPSAFSHREMLKSQKISASGGFPLYFPIGKCPNLKKIPPPAVFLCISLLGSAQMSEIPRRPLVFPAFSYTFPPLSYTFPPFPTLFVLAEPDLAGSGAQVNSSSFFLHFSYFFLHFSYNRLESN